MTFTPGRPQEHAAGLDTEPGTVRVQLLHNAQASKPWRVVTIQYKPDRVSSGTMLRPKTYPAGWYSLDGDFLQNFGQITDRSFRKLARASRYRHRLLAAFEIEAIEAVTDREADPNHWDRVR